MKERREKLLIISLVLFMVILVPYKIFANGNYDSLIFKYASKYGLDPYLVKGLIATESSFNPNALSSAGAIGLSQIMPETGRLLGYSKRDLYNPRKNIEASCKFLAFLKRKASKYVWDEEYTRKKMLQGYYAGPGYISKQGIDLYHMVYVNKVLKHYYRYKNHPSFPKNNYVKYKKRKKIKTLKRAVYKRLNNNCNKKYLKTNYYISNQHLKLNNADFEYFKSMRKEYNNIAEKNLQEFNEVKNEAQEEFNKIHKQMGKTINQNVNNNKTIINMKVVKKNNEVRIIFKTEKDKNKFMSLTLGEKLKLLGDK